MNTNKPTEQLSGNVLLYNERQRAVLRGILTLQHDYEGHAFVHVQNDITGIEERLDLSTPEQVALVRKIVGMMDEIFTEVDMGVAS